jgi:hypothetical protein
MAQLPSGQFLIQLIGEDVILFDRDTEEEIVKFNPTSRDEISTSQEKIHYSSLSDQDKCFAHFWSGYFYAHATK